MDDSLVNQRVKIITGGYRGYRGLVQHATNTHVRMELDATNKVITIERHRVRLDDHRLVTRAAPQANHSNFPPPTPHRSSLHSEMNHHIHAGAAIAPIYSHILSSVMQTTTMLTVT